MNFLPKALSAAILWGACGLAVVLGTQPGEKGNGTFELRLAESKSAAGLTEATIAGTKNKVYLHKETLLSNKDIAQAKVVPSGNDGHAIDVVLTDDATKKFTAITKKHTGKPIAMLVDGKVIFAPVVRTAITNGRAQITGSFSKEEATRIADALRGK